MAEPTLKQIRVFLAVARHRSFRAAADRVSASQSSISIQIKELEDREAKEGVVYEVLPD